MFKLLLGCWLTLAADTYSILTDAVRAVLGLLSILIYNLIIVVYDLFEKVATAQILDSAIVAGVYKRVGLILGLFMFFKLAFSLIKMVIDPDLITDKEKGVGKLITRAIIAVVLLAITPTIFKEAFEIQDLIMENNVVGKLLNVSSSSTTSNFGLELSENLFFTFFTDEEEPFGDDEDFVELKNNIRENNSFSAAKKHLNDTSGGFTTAYKVEFSGLLSVLVGGFVLWVLFVYCLNVGVRVVQLAFFQLIAPIPILSYISEKKDGLFSKWLKQCGNAYLDLFIRVAIIDFIVVLIKLVMESAVGGTNVVLTGMDWATKIVIILGLLTFALRAPELIKELFPNGKGNFGVSLKSVPEGAQRGIGTVGGLALGAGMGALTGDVIGGARRGLMTGAKKGNVLKNLSEIGKNQKAVNRRRTDLINNGGTYAGARIASIQSALGIDTAYNGNQSTIGKMKHFNDTYKALDDRAMDKALEKNINGIKDKENLYMTLKNSAANITEESVKADLNALGVPTLSPADLRVEVDRRRAEINRQARIAETDYNNSKKAAKVEYINQVSNGTITGDIETKRLTSYFDAGVDKYAGVAKKYGLNKIGDGSLTIDKYSRAGDMSTRTAEFENSDNVTTNKANAEYGGKK